METLPEPAPTGGAGSGDPGATAAVERPSGRRRPSRRLVVWLLVAVVVVGIAAAALWVGTRALAAKSSLERAEGLVGQLKDAVTADPSAAPALADRLVRETSSARGDTDGLLWRAGEAVPVLGRNLSVTRELAASVDDVARGAVRPLASAGTALAALRPVNGALDIAVIRDLAGKLTRADSVLQRAQRQVHSLDASGTIGQVADARDRLDGLLTSAADAVAPAAKAAPAAVSLLGGDGPRTYLLMFQNNAEVRSLGGNPASMLLLSVDQGKLSITGHASSRDFRGYPLGPIQVSPELLNAYDPKFPRLIMDIPTVPDFPTVAALGKAYWEQQFGGHVDAVISFDPVALADLLKATGPVPLPTGDTLTSDNAVPLLLYEVYARYPVPSDQDAFFTAASSSVFGALTSGSVDAAKAISSLQKAAQNGRLLLWSEQPAEQEAFTAMGVDGMLPTTNDDATVVGVYFNDYSTSKIDYFVDAQVTASGGSCPASDGPLSVTFRLHNRLDQQQADALPGYVASSYLPRGVVRTEIYVVGPPGSTYSDWTDDVPGSGDHVISVSTDRGRPVVRMSTDLGAGAETTQTVHFTSPAGKGGPLAVRTTPMVNPTEVTVSQPSCG